MWNYRVLAHIYKDDVFFDIHSVVYDESGKPEMYSEKPSSVGGSNIDEIKEVIELMELALKKPILMAGDKFPQEYSND